MTLRPILILDFGSQYNQLIARRIREMEIYAEILPYHTSLEIIKAKKPYGIILSGGPSSVNAEDIRSLSPEIFQWGIPILGICYGMQLTVHLLGGIVEKGIQGEYGKSELLIKKSNQLLTCIPQKSVVWMSHFDQVKTLPENFEINAISDCIAAISDENKKIYAVQFHPEVVHTEYGNTLLKNFVFTICNAQKNWKMDDYVSKSINEIRQKVGEKKVILGLSGGVDSSVAAVLIHRAIGNQLTCIFVDTGLLRKDEAQKVMDIYTKYYQLNIELIDAKAQFLTALENISDPEEKRKIIGHQFVEVFNQEASKYTNASFLAQGTIYPDVIESQSSNNTAALIKSHHNVGGLPEKMHLELLEPLRELFKDEVRNLGLKLGIPNEMVMRHPFPGPGLGIRIIGTIDEEKINILQKADAIFIDALYKNNLYDKVNQAFVVLLPVKSVGVMGDERTYEYTAVIRSVDTTDFMTATWSRLSYDFLDHVSSKIINEVKGINRVCYDISSKPPATIEWE